MTAAQTTIEFDSLEYEQIKAFAAIHGVAPRELVRQWTLERLEDEIDSRDLAEAIKADDGVRISWPQVKQHLATNASTRP